MTQPSDIAKAIDERHGWISKYPRNQRQNFVATSTHEAIDFNRENPTR